MPADVAVFLTVELRRQRAMRAMSSLGERGRKYSRKRNRIALVAGDDGREAAVLTGCGAVKQRVVRLVRVCKQADGVIAEIEPSRSLRPRSA